MKKILLPIIILGMIFSSCNKETSEGEIIKGYKPIYISKQNAYSTSIESPKEFIDPGKMYLYNQFIYISDYGNGVHIIDNSDPSNPKKVKFISIPGVLDVAVKNGYLYADNFTDLVCFNINDLQNISFTKRLKDVYPYSKFYPENKNGYFECVDTTQGYVIGWEEADLVDPKCFK